MHRQKYFLHAHIYSVFRSFPLSLFLHLFCTNKSFILLRHTRPHTTIPPCWGKWWGGVLNYWWSWPLFLEGEGGVCFQKPKLPLTWGQSFCPSESRSNLLTMASVSAGVLLKFKDTNCSKECQYAVLSNIWHCKIVTQQYKIIFFNQNIFCCCGISVFNDSNRLSANIEACIHKKDWVYNHSYQWTSMLNGHARH